MRTWLRVVLPPEAYFGALVIYLFITLFASIGPNWRIAFPLSVEGLMVLGAMAMLYGGYRVAAFHPVLRPDYRKWLELTPWQYGLPLPIGPVHLVLQDLLYVAGTTALSMLHERAIVQFVPAAFIAGWLLTTAVALVLCRREWHAYFIAFGLGGVPLVWWNVPALTALLAVLCVIA